MDLDRRQASTAGSAAARVSTVAADAALPAARADAESLVAVLQDPNASMEQLLAAVCEATSDPEQQAEVLAVLGISMPDVAAGKAVAGYTSAQDATAVSAQPLGSASQVTDALCNGADPRTLFLGTLHGRPSLLSAMSIGSCNSSLLVDGVDPWQHDASPAPSDNLSSNKATVQGTKGHAGVSAATGSCRQAQHVTSQAQPSWTWGAAVGSGGSYAARNVALAAVASMKSPSRSRPCDTRGVTSSNLLTTRVGSAGPGQQGSPGAAGGSHQHCCWAGDVGVSHSRPRAQQSTSTGPVTDRV